MKNTLRDAYREKLEARLEETAAQLALARAKARGLAADARIAAHEELADTERKLEELKIQLGRLRSAGDAAWSDVKSGVEEAWSDLNTAARRALRRFDSKAKPARRKR